MADAWRDDAREVLRVEFERANEALGVVARYAKQAGQRLRVPAHLKWVDKECMRICRPGYFPESWSILGQIWPKEWRMPRDAARRISQMREAAAWARSRLEGLQRMQAQREREQAKAVDSIRREAAVVRVQGVDL